MRRKHDCKHYHTCLDRAARDPLSTMACQGCQYYTPVDELPSEEEVEAIFNLWEAVFLDAPQE